MSHRYLPILAALVHTLRRVLARMRRASRRSCRASPRSDRPPPNQGGVTPRLTPIQRAALDVLVAARRPLKGVCVAAKCSPPRPFNTRFKEALSELVQLGLVEKMPGRGYAAPPRGRGDLDRGGTGG